MDHPSINIQGNIVSGEILDKIRNEDIKFQQAADFGLDRKTSVRDEIGIAWAVTRAHWTAFKIRRDRLKEGDSGTAETRNSWMIPLLKELGYEVEKAIAYMHPDTHKTYAISHKAANRGDFPIHIMGINDDLDKRRETSGPRLSPHALTQEYLNNTEHVYALVTNGRYLRLLRDATRLVRLSYLEINLEKMMEEELYADFAIFFRLLHVTRMPLNFDQTEESYIEYYHQESLASGSRIREKLSKAVEASIKTLANGFLEHPANETLCKEINDGFLKADSYYTYQLRLIYRLLFLIVTEERNLVYPQVALIPPLTPLGKGGREISQLRKIYYEYYSIERLRRLAGRFYFVDGRKHDLWEGLMTTFRLFEDGTCGENLGIKPLGSGIFSNDALGLLKQCKLSNEALLKVIRNLTFFENDHRQLVRVNYSDLDVEEFGSVYEGLLEYKPVFQEFDGMTRFVFAKGDERSKSGSHYTPEELVKPLIKHSLEYIIEEKLNESDQEKALLSIRVCDVASGSGHILLSAARRIALEVARVRTHEDQPSPTTFRTAIRDVIKNCIYGVDKNPLAVELCKVALWLESHNPGEPLNFLDHRIKCGDSIVGLANKEDFLKGIPNEAFKTFPGDDKNIAAAYLKRNKAERLHPTQTKFDFLGGVGERVDDLMVAFNQFNEMPERTPQEIKTKQTVYSQFLNSDNLKRLNLLADIQTAQFFLPKTDRTKDDLVTDSIFHQFLRGEKPVPYTTDVQAVVISAKHKFFHWFLEFPEVFTKGGFDCVVGNPPYLKAQNITSDFGKIYYEFLKNYYNCGGLADLVVYFLNRNFSIISIDGVLALITTNSISQGDSEKYGLSKIVLNNGKINFADKNKKWPGKANVFVSSFSVFKNSRQSLNVILNNKVVENISSTLDEGNERKVLFKLRENASKCFVGTYVLGDGFILSLEESIGLITKNNQNKSIIFPYLGGYELNNSITVDPSVYIISFHDKDEIEAQQFTECFELINRTVKPIRDKVNREAYRKYWWQFAEKRKELYSLMEKSEFCLIVTKTGKYFNFIKGPTNFIYDQSLTIIPSNDFKLFPIIQSTIHEAWFTNFGSTLKTDRRYSPAEAFETFPFPQFSTTELEQKLNVIGELYYDHRRQLILQLKLGLTKAYNLFHSQKLRLLMIAESHIEDKPFEKQFGKDALHLRKHLTKTPGTISFNEAVEGIMKLRQLHMEMDQAVLGAYGWLDIQLRHDFYEVDYLPENDRVRYTIHPEAHREVLRRLLELNHKIHEEEQSEGLLKKVETLKKRKTNKLIHESQLQILMRPENAYTGIYSMQDIVHITRLKPETIKRWLNRLNAEHYEGISKDINSNPQSLLLNFYGIHELIVIYDLRVRNKIPLANIISARTWLKNKFSNGEPYFYPFTSEKVLNVISKAGKEIIFTDPASNDYTTLGKGNNQLNFALIKDFLQRIVFDNDMVSRLYLSNSKLIAIDPTLQGGRPCTVQNEILIDTIKSVYQECNDMDFISRTYEIPILAVQDALDFEFASSLS
ncbi:MAG TPA: restriction endonuclease [Bacteroidales bacterium]|nr:restriction endonuclease [Bacteroidales bacterium]